ncbi:hypothetical protein DFH06DRAFT_914988, partial [Mycena polygramma]
QFSSDKHPQYSTHRQTVRTRRIVPVLIGPKFHRCDRSAEEKELWAQDIAILFKPWRSPSDLKAYDSAWTPVADEIVRDSVAWQQKIIRNMNVLTECRDAR